MVTITGCLGMRIVLWLGIAHAAVWLVFLGYPLILQAQGVPRAVERLEGRVDGVVDDISVLTAFQAATDARLTHLTTTTASINEKLDRLTYGAMGMFSAIVFGLVGVIWSLRQGWLRVST